MDMINRVRDAISSGLPYDMNQLVFGCRPATPSYTITTGNTADGRLFDLQLLDYERCGDEIKDFVWRCEPYVVPLAGGNQMVCVNIFVSEEPNTILCIHDRSTDVGDNLADYMRLALHLNINVLAYDPCGYGASSGEPSEAEFYANATTAWTLLTKHLRILPHEIMILGHALGSAAAVDLGTRVKSAGIILINPMMSAYRTQVPELEESLRGDEFCSIDKIGKVATPTLIVRGNKDDIFSPRHATEMRNNCPKAVAPLWLDEADHMDCIQYEAFFSRVKQFIKKEIWQPIKQRKRGNRRASI